ncbi:sigma factor [Micromonospora sp. NPDC005189]|uniref:sigma factor n=1 Tax=unclassified Micromonospora TaxID=2617518 RepID=UPI0033BDB23F
MCDRCWRTHRPRSPDLVQEAFCRAYARWDRLAGYEDPLAWVRKVAWNLGHNRWRRLRTAQTWLLRQRETHVAEPSPDRGRRFRSPGGTL